MGQLRYETAPAATSGLAVNESYEVDFTAQGSATLGDGVNSIDGRTWTGASLVSKYVAARTIDSNGITLGWNVGSSNTGDGSLAALHTPLSGLLPSLGPSSRKLRVWARQSFVSVNTNGMGPFVGVTAAARAAKVGAGRTHQSTVKNTGVVYPTAANDVLGTATDVATEDVVCLLIDVDTGGALVYTEDLLGRGLP